MITKEITTVNNKEVVSFFDVKEVKTPVSLFDIDTQIAGLQLMIDELKAKKAEIENL